MPIKLFIQVEDYDNGGYEHLQVDAEMLPEAIGGQNHFVHASTAKFGKWVVSEYRSGARAGWGWTIQSAIKRAEVNISGVSSEEYEFMILERLKEYGKANKADVPAPSGKSIEDIEKELEALIPEDEK